MDEEKTDPAFQRAFNNGYLLSKHEPDLLDKILKSDNGNNPYIKALTLGKEQQERDKLMEEKSQAKDRYPSWLTGDRSKKSRTEPNKTKEKGRDIEPER